MTESTTPAGRALLAWDHDEPDAGAQCESLWGPHWELHAAILAIEEQARAEGRREAVRLAAEWDAEAISAGTYSAHTLRKCAERLREVVARHGRSSDPEPAPNHGNVAAKCEDCGFTSPHAVARCGVPTADARWEAWPADAALQATGEPSARLGSQEGSE